MKKNKFVRFLLLSLTILIAISLSACGEISTPTTPNAGNASTSTAITDQDIPTASTATTAASDTNLSASPALEADKTAYYGALKLNDPTLCDKISDSQFKQQCAIDIADQNIATEAIAKVDASICAKLSTPDKQNSCSIQIQINQESSQQQAAKQQIVESEYKIRDEALNKLDYNACETISTSGIKTECEINVVVGQARQQKNPALCDKLDSLYQEACQKAANE